MKAAARCLLIRVEAGKHCRIVTTKAPAVLDAMLWGFHGAKSGHGEPDETGTLAVADAPH